MKNKLIKNSIEYTIEKHPKIKGLQIIKGKNNFPISWLNQQGYCEYSLYLQYFKGIKTAPTQAMIIGTAEHQKLEDKFKEDAVPTTFNEVLETSKEEAAISREMFVIAPSLGIRGFIDEIWMTPDEFVIIDDKPGRIPYPSTINQVLAYCLGFKNMLNDDKRKIKGALRERGTNNLFWIEEFDEDNENRINFLINRMQGLFEGSKPFIPTKNKNKCIKCRFQSYCEHF
ncbi:PD-(D/E)XK nuclease superfamily protein [Methanobrevibacter cuticularis]|uniref:PD-(D/E)XK nuclease superfamily protein n=1 Tax=Methanobrevibacter cuticularis TaxID=47311 RepID=A0A166CTZ4_9EURY|nr:Dna2/Cas4 domain-containing protein [Methanobrevibacter cuticularis]KZX16797.1 PD-(D/E)XK nuclease superfamily protein [Methanobrevibacter cuticularis]